MLLRKGLLAVPFALYAFTAHGGQVERDFAAAEMTPAVTAAQEAYKNACSGDLKIDVKTDTYETVDQMWQVVYFANKISESAPAYCKDDQTKSVMAKLQLIEVSRAVQVTVDFSGNKAIVTTDESSYPSWDMFIAAVDK